MIFVEVGIGCLVDAGHGIPIRCGVDSDASAPNGGRVTGKAGIDGKGLRVAVDAVVHIEPVEGRGGKVIPRGEAPDLNGELILQEKLLKGEGVKNGGLRSIHLLDSKLVADIPRRKVGSITVKRTNDKGQSMPTEKFFKIKLEADTEVIGIGEALAFSAYRIAGDIVCVTCGGF